MAQHQEVEQPTNPGGEPSSEAFPFPNGSERSINDRSQFVNLGSTAGAGNVQYIEINQGLVPVLGMAMSVNGPSVWSLRPGGVEARIASTDAPNRAADAGRGIALKRLLGSKGQSSRLFLWSGVS